MGSEHKWQRFEKIVAEIQQELAPNAIVTHDDKIMGHITETLRQVDVTVRQRIGQYNMLIAIDCKDYKRAVNINEVDQFIRLIEDIKANKGVMVAANGFSDTAKRVGAKAGLNLYRLIDTEAHDWQTYVSIPVICDFRRIQAYRFSIPDSAATFLPSMDPNEIVAHYRNYQQSITLINLLRAQWNSGKLPYEPGEHRNISLIRVTTGFTRGEVFEADVLVDIIVERRLFFGELPLEHVRGFADEYNGQLLTREFTTGWLNVAEVERDWRQLESLDEIAVEPVFTLTALDLSDIPETS